MSLELIFDTETTGIPDWKTPSGGEDQPHIVQLAALLVDIDKREITQSMNVIVKPDGWIIPDETVEVHGITTELAIEVGISEKLALEMFLAMWNGRKRVAYNTTFDNRIIRIGTKRYFDEATIDAWKNGDYECTMIGTKKIIGGKNIKLTEAYKHFTGKELDNSHSALADAVACMDIYFSIIDHKTKAA